jgi:hypothetical protein
MIIRETDHSRKACVGNNLVTLYLQNWTNAKQQEITISDFFPFMYSCTVPQKHISDCLYTRVTDPHHHFDADPDPGFHFIAGPYRIRML